MARLVIVSNRVPVPSERGPRAGGLAVALKDALKDGGLWFGWSGKIAPEASERVDIVQAGAVVYATVDLTAQAYRRFYVGYANGTLWPLLHMRLGLMEFHREDLEGYRAVNASFARSLLGLIEASDLVWVHDYQLIPLGGELRGLGVQNPIGFFLHIPFAPASVFTGLPKGQELLRDLCAYDVIGFHTEEYRSNFLDCLRQMGGVRVNGRGRFTYGSRAVRAVVTPIGIDARQFGRQAERAAKSRESRRLARSLAGRALMIGADRLDYSKGLPQRFQGFGRLLDRFPEHRLKVSFLQVAARSREDVQEYASLRRELDRLVGDLNGRHAEFDWVPLRYMTRPMSRSTLAGFFRVARVGVVTPLRDGMNLVAHEYVAAQDPADPGVLILSRFAGAASYFADALIVNPHDPDEIAEAMHDALTMALDERRRRFESLSAALRHLSADNFCGRFLTALERARPWHASGH